MSAPKNKKIGNDPGENWREGVYKFDDIKKRAYLDLLRAGGRRHASARLVGVSPQTVINHMHQNPEFAEEVSRAEIEADDEIEDALRMAAISGNVTAALAWLYSRRPERWRDERHTEVKGKVEIEHDWKKQAKEEGYDPQTLFDELVTAARRRLAETGHSGSDTGSAKNTDRS